jgi:hypothetical protein
MSSFGVCMQAYVLAGNVNSAMNCKNAIELHTPSLGACYSKIYQYQLLISFYTA